MRQRDACILLIFLVLTLQTSAQVFDVEKGRVQMAELHGLARFHTGDDPRWSEPNFDDSKWQLLRLDESWYYQGYKGYAGVAWYRFKIVIPALHPQLAIYAPGLVTSYQVFVDGRLIGQFGGLPPEERSLDRVGGIEEIHVIPGDLVAGRSALQVAIRVWHWPWGNYFPGGPTMPLVIGDRQILELQRVSRLSESFRENAASSFLMVGYVLAALAGCGFFLLRRTEYEYLWFAGSEIGNALLCLFNIYTAFRPLEFRAHWTMALLAHLAVNVFWPTFIVSFLREPRARLYWATITVAVSRALLSEFFLLSQSIGAPQLVIFVYLSLIPAMICTLLLLILPARRGVFDARLLIGPQIIYYAAYLILGVIRALASSGHFALYTLWNQRYEAFITWPLTASLENCADFIAQISVLAILILRFARSRRDEERMKSEFEAAQLVQQVLVAAEVPAIPAFRFESRYIPSGQVGGDFFQIVPSPSGGALISIGDVSGKGMPAAMTVSLLVGTFRTLAHYTQNPGEILAAMNRRMLARSQGGFTTCLVLRAEPDGTLIIANAGHIPPFINGRELQLENGLPLGLVDNNEYSESVVHLERDKQLTLMTDGVVEARDKEGRLFGFEQAAAISPRTAGSIAVSAMEFGQEDDITVLTLRRE
jgi:hypothetical protein